MRTASQKTIGNLALTLAAVAALSAGACGSKSSDGGTGSGFDGGDSGKHDGSASHKDGGGIVLHSTDGGGTGNNDASCGSVMKQAGKIPVDLVLVIETSFSMQFDNKWSTLSPALEDFVTSSASSGLNFGIQFFPLRQLCEPSAYGALAVPVGPQSTVAPLIQQAIDARKDLPQNEGSGLFGATPTVQVLEGIVSYLQANTQPGYKPVIVMATDGVPDFSCIDTPDGGLSNSLANAEAVASAAFAGTPSIPLFVIGVGGDLTPLNGLAAAGGTGAATLIQVGADAGNQEQAFINALNAIRQQSITCDFILPTDTEIDPSAINVTYTSGTGQTKNEIYVGNAAGCSGAPGSGWYFDNPSAPTEVILCSGACDVVKADPAAQVNVLLGCPRNDLK